MESQEVWNKKASALLFAYVASVCYQHWNTSWNIISPSEECDNRSWGNGRVLLVCTATFAVVMYFKDSYHISSINTTFSFSTPVWYYFNTSNIDIVVIFISSACSNSTVCHFVTPGITANYRVTMIILSIIFKL